MEDFANGCKFVILNKHIKEEVYLEQPMGYMEKGHENKILKLKRALYGLKQILRAWNNRIDKYFQDNNFIKCPHENALYMKVNEKDDILLVCG